MKTSGKILTAAFSIFWAAAFFVSNVSAQDAGDVKGDEGAKITKIGILMPTVKLTEATGEISPEEALRNTYAVLLKADTIELVPIESRLTSLALEEAAKLGVDLLLDVSLVQEQKKSGGGGIFGKVLKDTGSRATWETASKVPYGRTTGGRIAGSAARSAIFNTGYTMANMSVKIKKNDKLTLEYKLSTAKGEKLFAKTLEEKAGKDTDDLLMNMLEKSGEDIVGYLRQPAGGKPTP